jgi:hypothetical protein
LLAQAGANLDNDAGNRPALHETVYWGHVGVVRVLLEAGADPNIKDKDGKTPLNKMLHGPVEIGDTDRLAQCAALLRAHKGRE